MVEKTTHSKNIENHFDRDAQKWQNLYLQFGMVNDVVLYDRKNVAIDYLKKSCKPGTRILDAGCGAGIVALEIAQSGYQIHGVDISKEMIELCEKNLAKSGIESDQCKFTYGDIFDSEFPAESFEGIIALGFMQYQKDEPTILDRFYEMLEPGGTFIVTGPNRFPLSNFFVLGLLLQKLIFSLRSKDKLSIWQISVNKYSLSKFKKLLKAAGFTVMGHTRHGFAGFLGIRRIIGFKGELMLHRFFTQLSRLIPVDVFANDIVVFAKKPE